MSATTSDPTASCHVVAVPYPGRGHINPLMNLCKLLTTRKPGIHITFIVTEEWLGFISSDDKPSRVRFATIPNVIPSELVRGADIDSFIEAVMTRMEEPVERVLDRLQLPVKLLIADTFLYWAVGIGNRRNIPVASFWPMSASMFSILYHFDLFPRNRQYPVDMSEVEDHRIEFIPGISSIRLADLPDIFRPNNEDILSKVSTAVSMATNAQYLLFRSIYELEKPAIDALKEKLPLPIYTIGPTIPYSDFKHNASSITKGNIKEDPTNYFQWLNAQPKNSVLYVSFGSFIPISSAQMDEISKGLRDSGVRYLWVVREAAAWRLEDGGCAKGFIVPWCDQLRVLRHRSVGGFMTHCGWNSTLESAFCGVPVLTFPLVMDQSPNSKLLVEDWQVGWRMKRQMGKEVLVKGEEIGWKVKIFMDLESAKRKILEERCKLIQEMCQAAIAECGSSETSLSEFFKNVFLPMM
ncbi:hypothetical protein Nepgr_004333 [Nepenthes gracilis]|uniref:Glycosyltransferase n=1 Tax=Nepenthes gracilis TaxID=150966 RepID=A0AAD3S174_NEPGR|nr:hypothetical protein Nepgr_004333 [Nepenthes gracilis]